MQKDFVNVCLGLIATLKVAGDTDEATIALMTALMDYVIMHDVAA